MLKLKIVAVLLSILVIIPCIFCMPRKCPTRARLAESEAAINPVISEIASVWDAFLINENPAEEYRKIVYDMMNCWDKTAERELNEKDLNRDPSILVPQTPIYDIWEMTEQSINYEIADALFEGDIVLTPSQALTLDDEWSHDDDESKFKRKVSSWLGSRWPVDEPIKFKIRNDNFASGADDRKLAIQEGFRFWEENTCLDFEEITDGSGSYIDVIKGSGCYSSVGRTGGRQGLSIGAGCNNPGTIMHEIGHALGMWHEQSRPDRDSFITVNLANIRSGRSGNYNKINGGLTYDITYDFGSVMHYPTTGFAIDYKEPTMISMDPNYQNTMGQRRSLSFSDIAMINTHYGCIAKCNGVAGAVTASECTNGGYPHPKDCTNCMCPLGFGGRLCDLPQPAINGNCGGKLSASTQWQTLQWGATYPKPHPLQCSWHIESPTGTNIEIKMDEISGRCTSSCSYDFIEIKTGVSNLGNDESDFQKTGYRFCCYKGDGTMTSYKNKAVVIGFVTFLLETKIRYRYVGGAGQTTTNKPTTTTTKPTTTTTKPTTTTTQSTTTSPKSTTTTPKLTTTTTMPTTTTTARPTTVPELTTPTTTTSRTTTSTESVTISTSKPPTDCSTANWSQWGTWSECSKSCGGCGKRERNRECSIPGCQCQGDSLNYRNCNFFGCTTGSKCCGNFIFFDRFNLCLSSAFG